jgi:hypothetical protein
MCVGVDALRADGAMVPRLYTVRAFEQGRCGHFSLCNLFATTNHYGAFAPLKRSSVTRVHQLCTR